MLNHVNFSDAVRITLLSRFGGWYSDTNFVFLRPFESVLGKKNLRNVISFANSGFSGYVNPVNNCGNVVANELFHVDAGHIFMEAATNVFNRTLMNGEISSSGPLVLTKALEEICGQKNQEKSQLKHNYYERAKCSGITIVEPKFFYSLDLINARIIQSYAYWYELFKNSVAIHFTKGFKYYGSLKKDVTDSANSHHKKVLRPKDYGKNKPAVTYIGSTNCPLSFFSISPF